MNDAPPPPDASLPSPWFLVPVLVLLLALTGYMIFFPERVQAFCHRHPWLAGGTFVPEVFLERRWLGLVRLLAFVPALLAGVFAYALWGVIQASP